MRFGAGREVGVGHGHEVGGEGVVVGLLEAREGEGTGCILARCWIGGFGRLVGMKGAAVVERRAELVAFEVDSVSILAPLSFGVYE